MSRKIFMSFLGTGKYKECIYTFKGKESQVVTYVQDAIVELIASKYDKYYIFCTEDAKNKHLESLNTSGKYEAVNIPDGLNEDKIWEIFKIIFEKFQEGDEVIFDTTHSFRFMPMLGITLLQYAKFLKDINIRGIYYGAFEALGTAYDIEDRIPDAQKRKAPILDLTSFSILQDWSNAGSQFVRTGNISNLFSIADSAMEPILIRARGTNEEANVIRKINNDLKNVSQDFSTNRGLKFISAESITKVTGNITKLKGDILLPFQPILQKIGDELSRFEPDKVSNNVFEAVEWCINKGLIQQAITQLQEGVITILCERIGKDYEDKKNREIISQYIGFGHNKDSKKWENDLGTEYGKEVAGELQKKFPKEFLDSLVKAYDTLTKKRNDINHAGYISKNATKKTDTFETDLRKCFDKIKDILQP